MNTFTAAGFMFAAIVVVLAFTLWTGRLRRTRGYDGWWGNPVEIGAVLGFFLIVVMCALPMAVVDDFGHTTPAAFASGWTQHQATVVAIDPRKNGPTVTVSTGQIVEVDNGHSYMLEQPFSFSCPPGSDVPGAGRALRCVESSTYVSCTDNCVPAKTYLWWLIPAIPLSVLALLSGLLRRLWRDRGKRRTA